MKKYTTKFLTTTQLNIIKYKKLTKKIYQLQELENYFPMFEF